MLSRHVVSPAIYADVLRLLQHDLAWGAMVRTEEAMFGRFPSILARVVTPGIAALLLARRKA